MNLHERLATHDRVMVRAAYSEVHDRLIDLNDEVIEEHLLGGLVSWDEFEAAATLLSALPQTEDEAMELVVKLQFLLAGIEDLPHLGMAVEQTQVGVVHTLWLLGPAGEHALLGIAMEERLPDFIRARAAFGLTRSKFPPVNWPDVLKRIIRDSCDERAVIVATTALEDLDAQGVSVDIDNDGCNRS